jgi:hypothetical protein
MSSGWGRTRGRLLPALLLLSGCTSLPDTVRDLPASAGPVELAATPFFPQDAFQCGPAALATVLATSGVDVALDAIVAKVYLPAREGSLQAEMLAAARTEERLPYVIDGELHALHAELTAGRPVVVMQNLGVAAIPRWHFAVVVGIDTIRNEVILRSGTQRRRVTPVNTFLRTWRRSDYWGVVVLRPEQLPENVDRGRYFGAVAALEQAAQPDAAKRAWQTALANWPGDPTALFGLGNARLNGGDFECATASYRSLLDEHPGVIVARNNLALALAELGREDEALKEIERALRENADPLLQGELEDTLATIRGRRSIDR